MKIPQPNIRFFNTFSRKKEKFIPLDKGKVRIYTCGPTVWDFAHIGNWRAFIFEDLLRRWLEYRGFKVVQVMNLTDVDDKTIRASRRHGIPLAQYTEPYVKAFFEDLTTLGIKKADHYPRATDHIPEMVQLIKILMKKGFAYKGADGSVYYDISKFKNYGRLSKIRVEELRPGARVKGDEYAKEEAQDFALWKAWDEADGEVFWETELGKGRPGWHIECSTMSIKYLGETLDIHCGGVDNLFPHHENEIAQSEAATEKKFVNYWLHNEHLLVEGRKMSKTDGNCYTLRDLVEKGYDPKAIRYLLISTHYRQQLNFTFEGLEAAKSAVDRLVNFMNRMQTADGRDEKVVLSKLIEQVQTGFEEAMDDDLNISVALANLFNFVREVNKLYDEGKLSKEQAKEVYDLMLRFDLALGVVGKINEEDELSEEAGRLIREREKARKEKDWKKADEIREKLNAMGITIEDTPQGVKWRKR